MPGSSLTYAWVGLLQRTLDGGCSEFPRVLKPKIDKMGTLKKMGTQNPKKKGSHGSSGLYGSSGLCETEGRGGLRAI